ncbi:hypothetical protein PYR66_11565 [Klebsiella aerogenes]|nr:hypothetical protein PYR66_11565 [Klebsiella aerogenes]
MKYINDSLKLATIVEQKIKAQDPKQLESVKMYLMERMGTPVGLHTAGVPFILSALLSLISFSMPQLSLWGAIFQWLSWPEHAVFAGIIPTGFLYCLLIFPSMTLFSRGYMAALKFYLALIFATAALAACNLLYALIAVLTFDGHAGLLISAFIGVLFSTGSIKLINSAMFVKTSAFYLHNRVWRWQLKHHTQNAS